MNLAKEIVKFPQECLRSDRKSAQYAAYRSVLFTCHMCLTTVFMYSATSLEDALIYETDSSAKVLTTEAIVGAKKFAAGLGKHGKFNVNQVAEKEVEFEYVVFRKQIIFIMFVGMAERIRRTKRKKKKVNFSQNYIFQQNTNETE